MLGGGAGPHGRHGQAAVLRRAESGEDLEDHILKSEIQFSIIEIEALIALVRTVQGLL